jgi:glycosyltransferase involved in cell wall biosynthesis
VEDGVSGLLVPAGDVDALARAVQRLLDDPASRRALGQAARQRAQEKFSADRIVPLYVELYERVCALPHRVS